MKFLFLLALIFTVFAEENDTAQNLKGDLMEFLKRPEYTGYPYARAKHPVIGFEDGNGKSGHDEIFNFCGHPEGFQIEDIAEDCFYLPYVVSLYIPTLAFSLLVFVLCCSACIYSCCRMCLGQCCFATTGCCCAEKPRQYQKKEWLGFVIATVVLICGLQLPFFITGLTGNASMTVALNGMADQILDVYPTMKEVIDNLFNTLLEIDLDPLYDVFEKMDKVDNMTSTESTKRSYITEDVTLKAKSLIETLDKLDASQKRIDQKAMKLAARKQEEGDDDDEDIMGDVKAAVEEFRGYLTDITKVVDPVMDIIETIIDIMIIVRELIFDIVLIMPLIGGVLMIVGAFLRIHQLSVSFFPCAFFFSYVAIAFVAYEYPVTTVMADGCVVIYNVLEGAKQAEPTEFKTIADFEYFFDNSTTEELINEFLKIFVDCEKSIIGDVRGTVNSIIDDLISQGFGGLNMTFFEGLFDVCDNPIPGIFYNYNGSVRVNVDGTNYGDVKYDKCKEYGNTRCVYDLMQYALEESNGIIADPLLTCSEVEHKDRDNKDANILTKFRILFKDLMNMEFVNQNVYWVSQSDFAAIGAEKAQNGEGELDLDYIMENLENFAGLIDPELLEQLLGGLEAEDIPDENVKRQVNEAIKLSKLKRAGSSPIYCANLDGIKVDEYGNKLTNSSGKPDYVQDEENGEDYMYTNLACTPSEKIKLNECSEKCPTVISEIVSVIDPMLDIGHGLDQIFDSIENLLDAVADIADFVGCGTLGKIASDLPPSICETYLEAETTLVTGLVAYGIILWLLYIFGLVAIKRFNYANYLPVDKDDKRYYNQGEIELE